MIFQFSSQALYVFVVVILSWFIAHLLKPILNKEVSWRQVFANDGNMPSAHTSPASALMFAILFSQGFTTMFVFSMVFLVAIMRDAVSVRYAVGQNALALQELKGKKKLKHSILVRKGHLPREVIIGFLIGFLVALVGFWVL